jgi:hypothetical protein
VLTTVDSTSLIIESASCWLTEHTKSLHPISKQHHTQSLDLLLDNLTHSSLNQVTRFTTVSQVFQLLYYAQQSHQSLQHQQLLTTITWLLLIGMLQQTMDWLLQATQFLSKPQQDHLFKT